MGLIGARNCLHGIGIERAMADRTEKYDTKESAEEMREESGVDKDKSSKERTQ